MSTADVSGIALLQGFSQCYIEFLIKRGTTTLSLCGPRYTVIREVFQFTRNNVTHLLANMRGGCNALYDFAFSGRAFLTCAMLYTI